MSFVITLFLFLGLVAAGLAYLLFRRRVWVPIAVGFLVFAAGLVWALMPVCRPVAEEDVANFDPPIETRTETGMIGQRYFQQRDRTWFHCKVRIARELFF
jgi:hypothetical protein